MKWIASLLVLGVFTRHEGIYSISEWTGYTPPATFRMLGGAWEALLSSVVLYFALEKDGGKERSLIVLAAAIGIIEGIQTPLCRILIADIKQVPATTNLCDFVVGRPLSYALLSMYLFIYLWITGRLKWALAPTALFIVFISIRELANQTNTNIALFIMGCLGMVFYLADRRK